MWKAGSKQYQAQAPQKLERAELTAWLFGCNTCLADSPHGIGGQSARQRPDIYLDGRGTHLSFLSSSSLRSEPSGARALAPSSPPSVDLPPPVTKPRFLAREPSSAPPPPFQTSRLAPHGRNPSPPPPDAIGVARSFAPPSIRLSGRPPLEPTAGMDSW